MSVRLLALACVCALAVAPIPAAPPEVAPPPRPALDPLADWTPRPATGQAEPWEKATDKDWIDARFREMNTGPALNCTMRYPLGKGQETVYKATVVKLGEKGDAGVVFDRCTMRLAAAWTGGYLNHSDRRFGLLNTPTPKGEMILANPAIPGWADPDGKWEAKEKRFTAPLPERWARYRGMYVHSDRVVFNYTVGKTEVLDSPRVLPGERFAAVVRSISIHNPSGDVDKNTIVSLGNPSGDYTVTKSETQRGSSEDRGGVTMIGVADKPQNIAFVPDSYGNFFASNAAYIGECRMNVLYGRAKAADARKLEKALDDLDRGEDLTKLTKGGPKRWGDPIITGLVRGNEDGPFTVDTLTIPYKNRFNALFFCTGLDFLKDGRVAVCTCHGDVWLVTVDEKAATCSWQRFATGLYHPLGLKVVDGKVVVLERGQLTRLHDLNNDGEADFYECVNNDWHTGAGEHSYDTCLETDPQGNFYFFKTGDTDLPTGGCLMRVTKDGSKAEVFCTGFRHPIGMGMSPTGILTGADQEGNWMPATRIDEYKRGGFYGDMRGHHRKEPPKTYDGPLCWLPREVDNSAGGQVWVPKGEPGASATGGWTNSPLAGLPLHLSYGRCRPFVLLRQECENGIVQGGVAALDVKFLSGVCRGRFAPDGNLYVCGLNGWQTAAQADGCLQRVRYTGRPLDVPVKLAVNGNKVRLSFSRPLDAKAAEKPENYKAAWWNYRWSGEYGSKRWKVSNPNAEGQDEFAPRAAKLLDANTVELQFEKLQPVMQMQVGFNVLSADGSKVAGSVFLTIHTTGK